MSFSSSTTPADGAGARRGRAARTSTGRTVFTWILLALWVCLIAFALICVSRPHWLEEVSLGGARAEANAYKHYGDYEIRRHRWQAAISQYLRSLKIREDDPGVWLNLALAQIQSGQLGPAEDGLERALRMELTPQMKQRAALFLGDLRAGQGRSGDAVACYEAALADGARPDAVYRRLGTVRLSAGEYEQADSCFLKALEAQRDPLLPYREMLARTREDCASDSSCMAWVVSEENRVRSEADLDRYDTQILRQMPETDPEVAKTWNHLGYVSYQLGRRREAAERFRRSLEIWPDNPDAKKNLRIIEQSL